MPLQVKAQQSAVREGIVHIDNSQRLSLARSFVDKLKSRLAHVDNQLHSRGIINEKNILPEGEILLLQPILAKNLRIDGIILGLVQNSKILLSLRDMTDVLQIPILIDMENKSAKGWYVREERDFFLDLDNKIVRSDIGEFKVSDNVIIKDNDIWIPADELGQWMNFEFSPVISSQELKIKSSELLPIQERYNRRNAEYTKRKKSKSSLPRGGSDYKMMGAPSIDVATNSTYMKNGGEEKGHDLHSVNVRTAGDLAYGTLITQSRFDNTRQLSSVRVNYKQESVDADLLGALKARRFDIGDVTTARVPLGGQVTQELGVRITNTDPLRTFTTPMTGISGTAFPGWDVELYRNNQIVGFREIDDDGFYSFDNVNLFLTNNNFKLIFYGPQGEVREENVFVPVNQSLARGQQGVYDVSVSLDGENTYTKKNTGSFDDVDNGSVNVSVYYEKPIVDGTAVSAGLWSSEHEGERSTVGNVGVSTTIAQTLVNARIAVDDEGDIRSELSLRRDFGKHEFSNSLSWQGDGFDSQSSGEQLDSGAFTNNISITGPLPWLNNNKHRYNVRSNYSLNSDSDYTLNTTAGISSSIKRVAISEQFQHETNSKSSDDTLSSYTNISGSIGRNRLRFGVDYKIMPDSELRSVLATYSRDFTKKVKLELGATKRQQQSLMEYSAKIDWQAGFVRISPSIKYNSEQDFFAGLNTRFGILRDPFRNRVKSYDRNLTNSGVVSVFVYLDKNGDGIFNGVDEPLEGVIAKSLQNGGRRTTDENGVAMFTGMGKLRLTDIILDNDSLQDPTWVSEFEGVSILPREGYIAEVTFPVHIAGEIDGSVYARVVPQERRDGYSSDFSVGDTLKDAKPVPLRNVNLKLYNKDGEVENSVLTDASGFYYFPQVPPGRYFLIIDEKSAVRGRFIRPEPQQIEIGYDGNVIYGNNLYVYMGEGDIPSAFLPNLDDYKSRHPHIDFSAKDNDLVLNLGEFNSRLLMSVVWFKIRSRYNEILAGGELFVPPAQSFANIKTGKHTLRVGIKDKTLDSAYNRCHALLARDQYCKVEIYPSYMKQVSASLPTSGR